MKAYFGFDSKEVQLQVSTQTRILRRALREMSAFEHVILVKVFMHSFSYQTRLGNIYDLDHILMSRYLYKWLPK